MLRNLTTRLRRLTGAISRFAQARGGTTAVEFAIVGVPFLATLIAVLQVSIFLFAQMALQNAANKAARYFLTGQAQNNNWSATTVVNMVCPAVLFSCSNVYIVVQNYASFAAANTSAPQMYSNGQPLNQSNFVYDPGTPGEVMVVQLIYAWPVVTGPLGFSLGNLQNGAAEMMGVSAFRVEPY